MSRPVQFFILVFLSFNLLLFGFLLYPVPQALQSSLKSEALKIYDRHGQLLYEELEEGRGRQTYLDLEKIPEDLKQAFLSVEDSRFYEHSGVDVRSIVRAIWQNASAGEVVSGGSTITQQLVRNVVGVNEARTVPQKVKESVLALKLGKFMSKDEVLEAYLNTIYFGGLAYGVEAASQQYFGKSAVHLSLAEAAFLAGLPQAPNRYFPFQHFDRAKERQHTVLRAMKEKGRIDESRYQMAISESIQLRRQDFSKRAPHFVDYVLGHRLELPGSEVETTLDLGLQERLERLVFADLTFLDHFNIENAAAVVLKVDDGDILAMVGSSDYDNELIQGQVNVTTSLRQPGSSIKPLVYAAALEQGWEPSTVILDEPVRFDTEHGLPYSPKNYDLRYRGEVTVAESLAQSLNVPAVKALHFVGLDPFLRLARNFGLTSFDQPSSHYGLSLALGAGEVKLLELANAYRVFPNNGQFSASQFLMDSRSNPETILTTPTAQKVSAILSSNNLRAPAFGEENPLKFPYPVAAKTGTTRNFRDNWTIGYTDDYVVGVWVGNAGGAVMQGVSGISGAGPIFYKVMNVLHEETGTQLRVNPDIKLPVARTTLRPEPVSLVQEESAFRILSPFANDRFLYDPSKPASVQKIKLSSNRRAEWLINGQLFAEGEEVLWPLQLGEVLIEAVSQDERRRVNIKVE